MVFNLAFGLGLTPTKSKAANLIIIILLLRIILLYYRECWEISSRERKEGSILTTALIQLTLKNTQMQRKMLRTNEQIKRYMK